MLYVPYVCTIYVQYTIIYCNMSIQRYRKWKRILSMIKWLLLREWVLYNQKWNLLNNQSKINYKGNRRNCFKSGVIKVYY